jgi:hypothetical protein
MPTRVTLYHKDDGAVSLDSCEVEHALTFPEWRQTPWPAQADAELPSEQTVDPPRVSSRVKRPAPDRRRAPASEPAVAAPDDSK